MSHNFSATQTGSFMPVSGQFLGNDTAHNFAILGDEYLEAAKCLRNHFQGFSWPMFQVAFQGLENYLKSHLLKNGATLRHVERVIGHKLQDALVEAKGKGLVLHVTAGYEDAVMGVGEYYTKRDFQYRSNGKWELIAPDVLIDFVEAVRVAATGKVSRLPRHVRPSSQVTEFSGQA